MKEKDKHRETVAVLAAALVVAYAVREQKVFVILAGLLAVIGLASPLLSARIHRLWMGLAQVLGLVMTRVLLSVVYFVVLFPLAILSRRFSAHDSLRLKHDKGSSVYSDRDHTYTAADLENPW
jgi:hypothetical protein